MRTINHDLAGMFEIHGDALADARLHLPKAPVRLCGVAHQHAGFQNFVHRCNPDPKWRCHV